MLHLALRGVRHNSARYIATLLAILTGVAFFSATGFVSDRVIDALEGDVDRQYGNVDVAVVIDDSGASDGQFAETLTIPADDTQKFLSVPGIDAGGGVLTGPVSVLGSDQTTFGDGTTGRLWIADEELNPLRLDEGSAPSASGQIAIDHGTADKEDLSVGDQVTVLSVSGEHPATVVGITKFGDTDSLDGNGTVSIYEDDAFDWLRGGTQEYDSYYLRGSGDPAQLTEAVEPLVPSGFVAQTGEEFRADQRDQVGAVGRFLKIGLQGFAALALFVGAFVIYNTFSVIVAQRQRELAVLSAIGATPKQIKRALRFEGLVIGVLGSVLGVIAGFLLTFVLIAALSAFGVSLPGSGIKVAPGQVIASIVVGTLITLFSVMVPARRAAKIEPIEALREAEAETAGVSRKRTITAIVLVVLGLLGMLGGSAPFPIGLGALLFVAGLIVAGPSIAVMGSKLLRPVLSRLGLEGRLATDNSARNPRRTATTANALLIGVFLVTFVTVAGTSLKDFVVGELQKLESADFLITSDGGTIDPELVNQLEAIDGVEKVTPYRLESVTLNGEPSLLSTADDGALVQVADISASSGSLEDLTDGTIAVSANAPSGVEVGSTVTVTDTSGQSAQLNVVAVLEASIDANDVGNIVTPDTFDSLVGDTAPTAAFIDARSGAESDTKDAIDDVVSRRPDITVTAGNALGQVVGSIFDFLINAVTGLLLMSVLVALIGI
ncbi:MAG TPA: FtsX-like permease family protein, partial [Acidimicrobiales bacterium]